MHYLYTVIRRTDPEQHGVSPALWAAHPDWQVVVRTNVRVPGRLVWAVGGGVTLDAALDMADWSIDSYLDPRNFGVRSGGEMVAPVRQAHTRSESPVPIKNTPEEEAVRCSATTT